MALLELNEVSKRFGGLLAVSNLSFHVNEGEILGLIGPNGAGKTTVFNLVCGTHAVTSGTIKFQGKDTSQLSTHKRAACGIARTFQETSLFADFSVLENMLVARHLKAKVNYFKEVFAKPYRQYERTTDRKVLEILEFMGLDSVSTNLARSLPYGHQRELGIAMALAVEPRILLLDEPAAGMGETECVIMAKQIQKIRRTGITILLIEHSMKMVMDVCERIVVLNFGAKIAEGSPQEIRENPEVISAYLGVGDDAIC